MGGMAAQASVFSVIMNLDVSKGRKSSSNRRLPIIRIATQICVSPIGMNLDLSEDMNYSPICRRKSNPHPNLWSFDFIHSLRSPYGERCYRERAEMLISDIKGMFNAMDDGEISPSAYDTAWVAKVAAVDDIFRPQFPEALEWILQNQLEDGSWGTAFGFLLSDRLLSTLSCVITLAKWNTGDHQVRQGLGFLRNNLRLMNDKSQDSLVAEMELIFPSLLNEAKLLGLSLPYDLHSVHQLFRKREERLAMISVDSYHNVPSSLWYRLEGLQDIIDWERVMDVQSKDGSFLSSPAATACVYIHTGDQKCIAFLNNVLAKFRSCVPCVYPVDLLERLLAVDTVERLGIGRFFEREIKKALDYVYRYWDDERGIGYGRESFLPDLETTALGFRLLRLHQYNVSSAVFEQFKDHSGLFSSAGEISHIKEVESMLSLHRASQIVFPGEDTLDEAKTFTASYLGEALRKGEAFRLWDDKQNLAQEIKYALENPWYSSMPRFEAKKYCQVYRPDLGRLGKCIYKLPLVYNEKYLELAKLDFNIVQSVHQEEMKEVTRWFRDSGLAQLTLRQRPIELYTTVCLWTFEPEFRVCRLQYTKFSCLILFLDDIYDNYGSLDELVVFTDAVKRWDLSMSSTLTGYMKACFKIFHDTVHEVACEAGKEQRRELLALFRAAWEDYCGSVLQEAEWLAAEHLPTFDTYLKTGTISVGQVLLIFSGIFLLGHHLSEDFVRQGDHLSKFIELVTIASRLLNDTQSFEAEKARGELASSIECYMKDNPASTEDDALNHVYGIIDSAMKEMTWYFLKPDNVPFLCKKYIFDAARSFMVIFKDGDGYSVSDKEMRDYIRECLIEPVLM